MESWFVFCWWKELAAIAAIAAIAAGRFLTNVMNCEQGEKLRLTFDGV